MLDVVLTFVIGISLCAALCYLCFSSCASCCCLRSPKRRRVINLGQVSDETYEFSEEPRWIELHNTVPAAKAYFKQQGVDTSKLKSHNNLFLFQWKEGDGRFYLGYRIGPTHFPSKKTRLVVFSTLDDPMRAGEWRFEFEIHRGYDLREPQFFALGDTLFFYWFTLEGAIFYNFEPTGIYFKTKTYGEDVAWSPPEQPTITIGGTQQSFDPSTVPWDIKTYMGRAWLMAYTGDHYGVTEAMRVVFLSTTDGRNWDVAGCSEEDDSSCYIGGAGETAFEFCKGGHEVVAYSRNEDGDDKHGFGTVILKGVRQGDNDPPVFKFEDCTFEQRAVKYRFDSPRLFTHKDRIYLLGRYVYSQNDIWCTKCLSLNLRKYFVLFMYSARPKATALYRVTEGQDLDFCCFVNPSNGDTGFPSVVPTEENSFLIGNYTSRLCDAAPWILGQVRPTKIYLTQLKIRPTIDPHKFKQA